MKLFSRRLKKCRTSNESGAGSIHAGPARGGTGATFLAIWVFVLGVKLLAAQIESAASAPEIPNWVSHGRIESYLAKNYSPAGAFSPDSATLAVVNEEKVTLIDLRNGGVPRVLRLRVAGVTDLKVQSANYLTPDHLLILAGGLVQSKGKGMAPRTPELAFQWDASKDALSGKIDTLGAGVGYKPPRYFPDIRYVGLNKDNHFDLWNPLSSAGGRITIPSLTQQVNLFALSPDGHWLLMAQIEGGSTADPIVAGMRDGQFVDALRGHQGTVLSIAFSRDSTRVVTACEDGKVRIFSAPDWKLLQTLTGHSGPVHWAEFSPDGKWIVSAGEDTTARIWSAEDGKMASELKESQSPVLTASFSPDGKYIAASSEKIVHVWERARN